MDEKSDIKNKQEKLFYGGVIFGITIPIGFFIAVHFGSQIEFQRTQSSFLLDILLWIIEWIFIAIGVFLPWITWKKLVKPYKNF